MQQPIMRRVRGDGVQIELAVWEGRGKNVLAVHGLTANCRCWDLVARSLTPAHRLLAVDLRGRGCSDKPPTGYSEQRHVGDLKAVMDDLGLQEAVLMGHSLGGYIALAFAAEHPQRVSGLIIMDAGGDLSPEQWERVSAAIKPALQRLLQTFPSVEAYLGQMKRAPVFQPWSETIENYFRYDLEQTNEGVRSKIRFEHISEEMANKRQTPPARYYPLIRCPVLILRATDGILADDDILLPAEAAARMLREIPDARCVDLKGTNHYSILFQPNADRTREIDNFLNA